MSFPSHIWTTEGVVSKTRDRGLARGRGFFFLSFFFSFFFKNAAVGLVLWLNNPKTTFFLKKTDPNPRFTDKRHYLYVLHTWSRLALLTYFKITSPSLCLLCPPKQVHLIRTKVDFLTRLPWRTVYLTSPNFVARWNIFLIKLQQIQIRYFSKRTIQ